MLEDGYEGCGGFLDGSYLTQHPREDAGKYGMRRELAYYLNYLAPCVNAHVAPIFKRWQCVIGAVQARSCGKPSVRMLTSWAPASRTL